MTSAAQVLANRSNARKSTGPRTPEGKAAAAQNAVKHGLLAEQVVIKGEDPEEFDLYRAGMLAELAPVGAVEGMLAERAVSLAWRLRRAERLQSAVFATVYRENANDVVLWPKHGLPIQPGPGEDEVILGQVVMTDFLHAKVLDRLLVYERRIESSLYRTMGELRREREARAAAGPEEASRSDDAMTLLTGLTAETAAATEEVPRSEGGLAAGQEPVVPVKLGSFGADAVPEGALRAEGDSSSGRGPAAMAILGSFGADVAPGSQTWETALGSSEPFVGVGRDTGMGTPNAEICVGDPILPVVGNHGQDAHATETPCGVTMNPEGGNHGRDARATGTLHDRFCETNPISGGGPAGLG
jgi:hypothetical protein